MLMSFKEREIVLNYLKACTRENNLPFFTYPIFFAYPFPIAGDVHQ